MRVWHTVRSKRDRLTWRRHLPAWVGSMCWDRMIVGFYVRLGDHMWFALCDGRLSRLRGEELELVPDDRLP